MSLTLRTVHDRGVSVMGPNAVLEFAVRTLQVEYIVVLGFPPVRCHPGIG